MTASASHGMSEALSGASVRGRPPRERRRMKSPMAPGVIISPAAAANHGFTPKQWRASVKRTRHAEPEEIAANLLYCVHSMALNPALVLKWFNLRTYGADHADELRSICCIMTESGATSPH
jgi:hypothetical protein